MKSNTRALGRVMILILMLAGSAVARSGYGKLSGVVLDPAGVPQMGATVWLISEDAGGRIISQLLTNEQGVFSGELKPGRYSVRISLAGFLPALERHVGVAADLTTLLRVRVDSVFASLDTLRRKPAAAIDSDDWKWVLRSSAATRTILQWRDSGDTLVAGVPNGEFPRAPRYHGRLELTGGSLRPATLSNLSDSPATALSYDQSLGTIGRVLLAGQMSYEHGTSGAFASVWLPGGSFDGPQTTFVMRQAKIGINGVMFQGLRVDHTERLALTDRVSLRAGAEFVRVDMVSPVSDLHPHAQLDANLSPTWTASVLVAANPLNVRFDQQAALQSAISLLDSLPVVLFRDGKPVLENAWHQEVSVKHRVNERASVEAVAFHDSARHQAIFGSGNTVSPDFFQDAFSNAFLYDGGASSSWGTRLAYRQKLSENLEFATIYAWAGALSPTSDLNTTASDLRRSFGTRHHHSVAARLSGKIPYSGTQVVASYKWISGTALTRPDPFGEAAYRIDPYLHFSIRQPLPGFGLGGRWEALADFSNLLAEGYVPVSGRDSRIMLVPVLRSFRGGLSFQF